jgi:sugar lactone lactonase YvrE
MATHHDFETLFDGGTMLEGPRWRDGRVWFSDFFNYQVKSVDLDGNWEIVADVPQMPSGLGWDTAGRLLIVSMHDHKLFRVDGGELSEIADMSKYAVFSSNDMVVDAEGRAYVGNFGFDSPGGAEPRPTCIVRVDPGGMVRKVADDIHFPNGMAISDDGKTLVVAESRADRLAAFDINDDGSLANRRLFADLGPGGFPDGICMDAEGAVWVAAPRPKKLSRVFEGGTVAEVIEFDERLPVACVLGGADRCTLFLASTPVLGPRSTEFNQGKVEMLRVDVPGAGIP